MSKSYVFILFNLLFYALFSTSTFAQEKLQFVKVVKQKGPVAYRDPIGAVSPDGQTLIFSDSRTLEVQPISGGTSNFLNKNGSFVRYFTWTPNGDLVTYEIGAKNRNWYIYNIQMNTSIALWPNKDSFIAIKPNNKTIAISRNDLRELTWSQDGKHIAGLTKIDGKTLVIEFEKGGNNPKVISEYDDVTSIQWNPSLSSWAGIVMNDKQRYIDLDLINPSAQHINGDIFGKIAFTKNGKSIYYGKGNADEILELWKHDIETNQGKRLTNFSKDTYGPTISQNGNVIFKLKDYRIYIAAVSAQGGPSTTLTSFQSELPYWHPDGKRISFTYGTWRRVMDDAKYPDIDQNLGWVYSNRDSPAQKPDKTIRASYSEDQGMCWSPNLEWIAFHTHANETDDIWIMPASDTKKAQPLTSGGYETGWPRWSPDSKWIVSTTGTNEDDKMGLIIIGVNQHTGEATTPQKFISSPDIEEGNITDVQWTSDSQHLVVEYVVDENRKELWVIPKEGGKGRLIHTFESDQLYSGIGLSSDDQWIAFIAPDNQGYFQLYRVSFNGKQINQVTFDPTNKAHPVYSPTEDTIAFSVFNYQVIFWQLQDEF